MESAATKPSIIQLMSLKTAQGKELEIIKSIAPWWKQLGYLMDFDEEGQIVDLIEAKYQLKLACCRELFHLWLMRPDATWENLIQLLCDCQHNTLAEDIKKALGLWMVLNILWLALLIQSPYYTYAGMLVNNPYIAHHSSFLESELANSRAV